MTDRRRGRTQIVNLDQIMTDQQIKEEKWTLTTLSAAVNTKENCMLWLARRRLIKNSAYCTTCHQSAYLNAYAEGTDGFRWACRSCHFRRTIRDNSFFARSHIPIVHLLLLIYCWSHDMPIFNISHETKISTEYAMNYCNTCREECEKYIYRHRLSEIGGLGEDGEPIIVDINESKNFKRKYVTRESRWVFGGIERHSRKCFLVEIPNNTVASLTEAIKKHILPGTHIVSHRNSLCAYISDINNGTYSHSEVKMDNFTDPKYDVVHAINVEKMWMRAKRFLEKQFGTTTVQFSTCLNEFIFRNSIKKEHIFGTVLVAIAEDYVV
ncbi:hypothetical protein BgiMline_016637, partial [Biomphalaria glabrata]|nr:uncharacterized protein LOC106079596 isoform X2 [Biomphalaria glabrata]